MAGIFREGFDWAGTNTVPVGYAAKYSVITGLLGVFPTGRFGGRAFRISIGALVGNLDAAVSSLTIHAGLKIDGGPIATPPFLFSLRNNTTYTLGLTSSAADELIVYRATGQLAGVELGRSAPGTFIRGQYYSFAMEVVISDAAGRVTIYLDNAQVLNLTGVDTNNAVGTVNIIQIGPGSSGTPACDIDDIYITDSATRLTNHPRIVTLVPNGDDTPLNLVPSTGSSHFAVVDELPASAADFLSGSTVGDRSVLFLEDLAGTPLDIQEVNIVGFLQKTDATSREMALGVISGATTSDGPSFPMTSTGNVVIRPMAVDPDTTLAWDAAGVNGLKLNPKVTV